MSHSTLIYTYICTIYFTVNLTQAGVFMDRIYRIDHSNTYSFNAPTLVTSASHKIKTKKRYSMSKDTAFNGETTLRRTFLFSDLQCLPPGDPRILCA